MNEGSTHVRGPEVALSLGIDLLMARPRDGGRQGFGTKAFEKRRARMS